jgi:hypothetical protein
MVSTGLNLGGLMTAVQRNCHISDARFAGNYSMCTFLLKMREYYRWEADLPFSARLENADVGDWLAARERDWQDLADDGFAPLPLAGGEAEPFDDQSINRELVPLGYTYSSGLGVFRKPHFLLGRLKRRYHSQDGIRITIADCEYARDLVAPPAMARDDEVFINLAAVRRYLWERIQEARFGRGNDSAWHRGLATRGYTPEELSDEQLEELANDECEVFVWHELGELRSASRFGPGDDWRRLLAAASGKHEFRLRVLRDHLADTEVTLGQLARADRPASVHFWFGNLGGLRRALWPEAYTAYQAWCERGDPALLAELAEAGAQRWRRCAAGLLADFRREPDRIAAHIERHLPLED